jgi:hypothetical protein
MNQTFYQLVCKGITIELDLHMIYSKKIFKSIESAMGHKEEFKKKCTTALHSNDFSYLIDDVNLEISMRELILEE